MVWIWDGKPGGLFRNASWCGVGGVENVESDGRGLNEENRVCAETFVVEFLVNLEKVRSWLQHK